jgi:hypothetical protein
MNAENIQIVGKSYVVPGCGPHYPFLTLPDINASEVREWAALIPVTRVRCHLAPARSLVPRNSYL